ncbi:MAG TPA: sporulation protein [Firmicutes bacterium]|nr:sporulation protein [Bacillota bacterium]
MLRQLFFTFSIALGVVLGGTFLGGLSATLSGQPPGETMLNLAERIKVWAIVVALEGTFSIFQALEAGLLYGQLRPVARQLVYILAAFLGAHLACLLVAWLVKS